MCHRSHERTHIQPKKYPPKKNLHRALSRSYASGTTPLPALASSLPVPMPSRPLPVASLPVLVTSLPVPLTSLPAQGCSASTMCGLHYIPCHTITSRGSLGQLRPATMFLHHVVLACRVTLSLLKQGPGRSSRQQSYTEFYHSRTIPHHSVPSQTTIIPVPYRTIPYHTVPSQTTTITISHL